jgi:hypothetical protein
VLDCVGIDNKKLIQIILLLKAYQVSSYYLTI